MNEKPIRKKNRLQGFDYSLHGDYFITICTQNRKNIFWKNDYTQISTKEYRSLFNKNAFITESIVHSINNKYQKNMIIEKYAIMPDHIHMIIYLKNDNCISVEQIVRMIKREITIKTGIKDIWQKGFYDHIIRDQKDYDEIWDYVDANPRIKTNKIYLD